MDVGLITALIFLALILTLCTGLPLAFVMGGVAVIFTFLLWGPHGLMTISAVTFGVMHNFILTSIPLFIFMGIILQHSGIAEALYEMMYKWTGSIRGGLAIGTVAICAVFAAMAGVSGAATVAMGVIALPSMLKHQYDKELAIGCISAGGSLGILIPPSVLMIVYGVFANESIGALFAGGVLPGVLLAGLFIVYIAIRSYIQPHLGPSVPKEERSTWVEKLVHLRAVVFPIVLILLVLGTIFGGIATPTEAAAIGALGALGCAAINRTFSWDLCKKACYETLRLSCMVCWIIIGGSCFTSVYTAIGAIDFIQGVVNALPVSRYIVLVGMQVVILILGMLMDPGGIIMICTPVFVPLIKSLGFDPVWFGILFTINMEMGYLTPPFGFNLFYMKAIVPQGINMTDIYKSIVPFVLLQSLGLVLVILFPDIALWLPRLLIR